MASYRRLPNRKWQAEVLLPVRLPSGRQKRITKTHPSKGFLREWATKLEAAIDAGRYTDQRASEATTVRDMHALYQSSRMVADATRAKTESFWRNHVEPAWGGHPVATVTRPALRRWVKDMSERTCAKCLTRPALTQAGVMVKHQGSNGKPCPGSGERPGLGGWVIQGAVSTLSALLAIAVEDGVLPGNPAVGLRLPRIDAKPVFFWTKADARRLLAAVPEQYRLMVDLDLHIGLRWGELAGLRARWVDVDHGIIHVVGVQTRTGWREYPKSRMSRRTVPIPDALLDDMRDQVAGLGGDDYVFPAPEGGPWDDTNFRRRVFTPSVKAAGVPHGTPHDMRHTAASWLVQAGVDLYRVQALLGHEKPTTTQRYAHLAPDAFDPIRRAWG
jgi:site-specific recombinase XerC